MTHTVSDSLLIKTVLAPSMNFDDTTAVGSLTQGVINRRSLLNRVKKLDQADRQALMAELNFLSARMAAPEKIRVTDLQEKGLCTLLLSDNGLRLEAHGFLTRIYRGFCNTFGSRISSASLVEKFAQVRGNLVAQQNLTVLADNLRPEDTVPVLKERIRELEAMRDAPNGNDQIIELNKKLIELDKAIVALPANAGMEAYVPILVQIDLIGEFIKSDPTVFDADRLAFLEQLPNVSNLIMTASTAENAKQIAEFVSINDIPVPRDDQAVIHALVDDESVSREKMQCKYWVANLVKPFARSEIRTACFRFTNEIQNAAQRKAAITGEIRSIKGRLAKLEKNLSINEKRTHMGNVLDALEAAEHNLINFQNIGRYVTILSDAKSKPFLVLKSVAASVNRLVQNCHDDGIKNTEGFSTRLSHIVNVLNGDASTNAALAASIQLDTYQIQTKNSELHGRLSAFITNQASYPIDTEERRQSLVCDYIEYLKIVFAAQEGRAREVYEAADSEYKKVDREMDVLLREGIPHPVQVPVEPPVEDHEEEALSKILIPSPAPEHSPNGTSQLDRQGLVNFAFATQEARASVDASKTYYTQVKTHPLANTVYQNFYFIMKSKGMIKVGDLDWGKLVFLAENGTHWEGKVNNMPIAELNNYRVQAMVDAINGLTRVS